MKTYLKGQGMFEKKVNHNCFWAILIILASMGSRFALADQAEVDKATVELKVLSESLDANDINNTTNNIRAEYLQLKSIVKQESDASEQVKTFDKQAINLLTKWRNEAPKDVVDEISNL